MRHPLHSLCPYFAMFPEDFVERHLLAYSRPGDLVLDPFAGRGTTLLTSLLNNRQAIGTDINPVAACVAGAKTNVPPLSEVLSRIAELRHQCQRSVKRGEPPTDFFRACYHLETLQEVIFLRTNLNWRRRRVDRFIAALVLSGLHGEAHKSELCMSNRMPRTISTKPNYSIRWWQEHGYIASRRKTFDILEKIALMRYKMPPPAIRGGMRLGDARKCGRLFPNSLGQVSLVITSPPYIDTTDYAEDQWLRLWFLGGPDKPIRGSHPDDRHTKAENYWAFLSESWAGIAPLLAKRCHVVVRIGGRLSPDELFTGLSRALREGIRPHGLQARTLYRQTSEIKTRQTDVFRPGTSPGRMEHDFVFSIASRL
jgi:hypothetical protein